MFQLDQSKILSSGNELHTTLYTALKLFVLNDKNLDLSKFKMIADVQTRIVDCLVKLENIAGRGEMPVTSIFPLPFFLRFFIRLFYRGC